MIIQANQEDKIISETKRREDNSREDNIREANRISKNTREEKII